MVRPLGEYCYSHIILRVREEYPWKAPLLTPSRQGPRGIAHTSRGWWASTYVHIAWAVAPANPPIYMTNVFPTVNVTSLGAMIHDRRAQSEDETNQRAKRAARSTSFYLRLNFMSALGPLFLDLFTRTRKTCGTLAGCPERLAYLR